MALIRWASNAGQEPKRQRALIQVIVGGQDVTNRFNPFLLNCLIIKKEYQVDECHLELDDRYGILRLPSETDTISVGLGWQSEGTFTTFTGIVSDLISYAQKRSGRRLRIEAKNLNLYSAAKGQVNDSIGDGETEMGIGDAIKKMLPDFDVTIDPSLGDKKTKYLKGEHESPMQFAGRLADQIGGVPKWDGNKLSITPLVGGSGGSTVNCLVGKNVIGWNIHIKNARPTWKSVGHVHFDPIKAKWFSSSKDVKGGAEGISGLAAVFKNLMPAGDQNESEQKSQSGAWWSSKKHGYGWTMIDGEPTAEPQSTAGLSGYRDGVDGNWRIIEVEHHYSRGGFVTRLDIDSVGSVGDTGDSIGDKEPNPQ